MPNRCQMTKVLLMIVQVQVWASMLNAREIWSYEHSSSSPGRAPSSAECSSRSPLPLGVKLTNCTCPGLWALTFDDGPSTETTHKVLDALKASKVQATFFVIGENLLASEESKAVTRRAFNEGHLIASHSFTHPDFNNISQSEMLAELAGTSDAIFEVIGRRPRYFRPPYGHANDNVLQVLRDEQYKVIMWNFDPLDWRSRNVSKIFEDFEARVEGSEPAEDSVMSLTHDIVPATAEVVTDLISIIGDKGFEFVRADDCLKDSDSPYW